MVINISGENVPRAYIEGLWKLEVFGIDEVSRNGPVRTIPQPVVLEIISPWERVLFNPIRDANPFFHAMEFVWMMAGSNDAEWISMFNKRMMEYADDGVLRGAYGWRWSNPQDQIKSVIELLKRDPNTRQAVLSMWDVLYDGPQAQSSDRPCNTHIYFRRNGSSLNMTVCNRSNDFIWGMMGSNAVHMTMLHELVSRAVGLKQGIYRVFTNNLHMYTDLPNYKALTTNRDPYDFYNYGGDLETTQLLQPWETWEDFRMDCEVLVNGGELLGKEMITHWMATTGIFIHDAYLFKERRSELIPMIESPDWRRACNEWWQRRKSR